jgi:ABC-type lipoprotein release transport system permease subunit
MLFGLSPIDPGTYAGVSVLLIGVALAASGLPALRASRLQPAEALREE